MKKSLFLLLILSILLINFVNASSCDVDINDYEDRLSNIEQKLDLIESHYNLLPTIAQDIKSLSLEIEDIQVEDSNFKIYLVPGTIIIALILILTIILVRKNNG